MKKISKKISKRKITKRRNPNKKLLILDIDETLVYVDDKYAFEATTKNEPDFIWKKYYGIKRPFLNQFLRDISKRYDLALWTSGSQEYANAIYEIIFEPLDIDLVFLFSKDEMSGKNKEFKKLDTVIDCYPKYIKEDILALDNSPEYFSNDSKNLIPIKSFYGNQNDQELIRVFKLL